MGLVHLWLWEVFRLYCLGSFVLLSVASTKWFLCRKGQQLF